MYRRRRKAGNFSAKLTKVSTVNVPNNATSVWACHFALEDFDEFKRLAPNFEACVVRRCRVRVIPLQNVSNNSTSALPSYCIAPWHQAGDAPKTFNSYLSIDKAKIRRQTQGVSMNFVPSCRVAAYVNSDGSGNATGYYDVTKWRPRFELSDTPSTSATYPRIYTGVIAFQGDSSMEGRNSSFNVIHEVHVVFKNQAIMRV